MIRPLSIASIAAGADGIMVEAHIRPEKSLSDARQTINISTLKDIISDINKKRGRVIGMEPEGNNEKVIADIPLSEMFKYATDLRSMTQGRGSFSMEFEKYEEVPSTEVDKIIEDAKKIKEAKEA